MARISAKQTKPITGVIIICEAGLIEMKVMETPASEPSRAARGVILRIQGARKPPAISTKLCTKTQVSPASQACTGSWVLARTGIMMTKVTTNMCGTLVPEGSAVTSSRPVLTARR